MFIYKPFYALEVAIHIYDISCTVDVIKRNIPIAFVRLDNRSSTESVLKISAPFSESFKVRFQLISQSAVSYRAFVSFIRVSMLQSVDEEVHTLHANTNTAVRYVIFPLEGDSFQKRRARNLCVGNINDG